jgi:hypothetical protein
MLPSVEPIGRTQFNAQLGCLTVAVDLSDINRIKKVRKLLDAEP